MKVDMNSMPVRELERETHTQALAIVNMGDQEDKKPEVKQPEEQKPVQLKTDEPKSEEPKKEESKVEEPKTEEPKTEKPKREEPKAENKKGKKKAEKPKESLAEEEPVPKAAAPEAVVVEEKPAPPGVIVLSVALHCEGCATKVRKCLKPFPGVERTVTDVKARRVYVKGENADPSAVLARVQKKCRWEVELIYPLPEPQAEDAKKAEEKGAENPQEKAEVITGVYDAYMHCEACAHGMRKCIFKMSGIQEVELDLESSRIAVKGTFDPYKLVDFVKKKLGKQVLHCEQKLANVKEDNGKGKKIADAGNDKAVIEEKNDGSVDVAAIQALEKVAKVVEQKRNEVYYYDHPEYYQVNPYPPRYEFPQHQYPPSIHYPPSIFSDEDPNSLCFIM